jgi:hypothetical protein
MVRDLFHYKGSKDAAGNLSQVFSQHADNIDTLTASVATGAFVITHSIGSAAYYVLSLWGTSDFDSVVGTITKSTSTITIAFNRDSGSQYFEGDFAIVSASSLA